MSRGLTTRALPSLVTRVAPAPTAVRGWRVDVDEQRGLSVFDPDGAPVESIDALLLRLGQRPAWRRPVVAGAPIDERAMIVARRVAEGRTTREIAAELGVSDRTVTSARATLTLDPQVPTPGLGSRGVAVIGRPGITRDLVRAALADVRSDVGPGGVAHRDDRVRVLVTSTTRDFAILGRARLVIVGALPGGVSAMAAIRGGAVAFVPVDVTPADLAVAVDRATRGEVTVPGAIVQHLVNEAFDDEAAADVELTGRESDVVEGIRRGESVKQTARRLGLSPKTIENRRQLLYARFGVRTARSLLHVLSGHE